MGKRDDADARWHLVPCKGSAHDPEVGGMVDNCTRCAPRWGLALVPVECATHEAWWEMTSQRYPDALKKERDQVNRRMLKREAAARLAETRAEQPGMSAVELQTFRDRLRTAGERPECPDGGTCHHDCGDACFRVDGCAPLSGVFDGDRWPAGAVPIRR